MQMKDLESRKSQNILTWGPKKAEMWMVSGVHCYRETLYDTCISSLCSVFCCLKLFHSLYAVLCAAFSISE